MTSIIHKYLYEHFLFVDGKITSKSAYERNQDPSRYIYFTESLSKILVELCLVFAMTKKELKYYIKGWVRKQNRGFDFEKYWNPPPFKFGGFFPKIKQVFSRTIAMDLARVEPMEQPTGIMQWGHFVGNQPEPAQMLERYANRPVNSRFYGTVSFNREGIISIDETQALEQIERRQRLIDLWEPMLRVNRIQI